LKKRTSLEASLSVAFKNFCGFGIFELTKLTFPALSFVHSVQARDYIKQQCTFRMKKNQTQCSDRNYFW